MNMVIACIYPFFANMSYHVRVMSFRSLSLTCLSVEMSRSNCVSCFP